MVAGEGAGRLSGGHSLDGEEHLDDAGEVAVHAPLVVAASFLAAEKVAVRTSMEDRAVAASK